MKVNQRVISLRAMRNAGSKKKRPIRWMVLSVFFFCIGFSISWAQNPGRTLVGNQGAHRIQLETVVQNNTEYVRAAQLVKYFEDEGSSNNRWEYNALLGRLQFIRADGQQVGLFIGDQRIVVGDRIIHTGNPPIRQGGDVYLPLTIVFPHMFPNVNFTERQGSEDEVVVGDKTPTPALPYNPFSQFTPTPFLPSPTQDFESTRDFQPAREESPTPFAPFDESFQTVTVFIDPGHSEKNPGAVAPNGKTESQLTLEIGERLAENLRSMDQFEVILSRSRGDQQEFTAKQRASMANSAQAKIFISLHCGALNTDEVSRGVVYFMNDVIDVPLPREKQKWAASYQLTAWHEGYKSTIPQSRMLAGRINQELRDLYQITNIIQIDSNPRPGRFHILRGLTMPGVLIELGNVNHPTTTSFLSSPIRQKQIAQYLADAVTAYWHAHLSGR